MSQDSSPTPSPEACERCGAQLPEPESAVPLCAACYCSAADTCCSDED